MALTLGGQLASMYGAPMCQTLQRRTCFLYKRYSIDHVTLEAPPSMQEQLITKTP